MCKATKFVASCEGISARRRKVVGHYLQVREICHLSCPSPVVAVIRGDIGDRPRSDNLSCRLRATFEALGELDRICTDKSLWSPALAIN